MIINQPQHFKHVCPRNCLSNCTMITTVSNKKLISLQGNKNNSYTNGKLCAKGYAYIERNYHEDRLKYPYYQKEKGSGKFTRITWKRAFELILSNMLSIHEYYGHFSPVAFYKGTGNIGVHHEVTDNFFSNLKKSTKIVGSSISDTGFTAIQYDTGVVKMSHPTEIKEAAMIIIWGANPAATNIHLIPYILAAKTKGAKLVVIDPIYSQTAELADLYIQTRPSTDGALANLLTRDLIEFDCIDHPFLDHHTYGFQSFNKELRKINKEDYLKECGIVNEAYEILLNWLKTSTPTAHIIGTGLLKHENGGQNVRAIEALTAIHGDIGKKGGGIFFKRDDTKIFQKQKIPFDKKESRVLSLHQLEHKQPLDPPIKMLWITGGNLLVKEPNSSFVSQFLKQIPFVVTVDLTMTQTALMSNLILPTTTHFEEADMVANDWYKKIQYNERAVPPYYESLSEWEIMNTLATALNDINPNLCHFPIHNDEEAYLNHQFTEDIYKRFFIKNIDDLKQKSTSKTENTVWTKGKFATESGKYEFFSSKAEEDGHSAIPIYKKGRRPSKVNPYWLLSPHHSYTFNSQFSFLDIDTEKEAFVRMHPTTAKKLSIDNGDFVTIYNDQGEIEVKTLLSNKVPPDILLIYHRSYKESDMVVNELVPSLQTDMGENGMAFFDTFVNVRKI